MSYFRVMLTSAGKVHSCIEVPKLEFAESLRVFFLEADSKSEAEVVAYNLYKESQRLRQKERRHKYIDKGKCPDCGGPPKKPFKHCQPCLSIVATSKKRKSGKLKTPAQPKSVSFAATRERREDAVRLALIQEVWKALSNDKVDFYEWLKAKLASLVKKVGHA